MTTHTLTTGDDVITTDNFLYGNVTNGASGIDLLSNTVDGGTGTDTFSFLDNYPAQYFTLLARAAGGFSLTSTEEAPSGGGVITRFVSFLNFEHLQFNNLTLSLAPSTGNDLLNGDAGRNRLYGYGGADTLIGQAGVDFLYGGEGADSLYGGSDVDVLEGQSGNDTLYGGIGADRLYGGTGNDTLSGGTGIDRLSGEGGSDRFVFDSAIGADRADLVLDFVQRSDYLVLDDDIFKALQGRSSVPTGWLRLVTTGHAAQDSNDYLIYNSSSDQLYYDPDGTGPRGAMLVATITMTGTAHPSATNFLVIP